MIGAIQKAAFGAPCNGCGLCCQMEVCAMGKAALGNPPAPCPGLVWRDGRSSCLLVETADRMGPMESDMVRYRLGVGMGCDADDDVVPVGDTEEDR